MIMAFPFYFPFNCKHLPTIPVGVPSDLLGMLPHCCPFFPGPGTPRYVSHKAYHETSQNAKNSLHFGNCLRNLLAILASFMKVPLCCLRFSQPFFPSFPWRKLPRISSCSNCLCGQQRSWWSSMCSQILSFSSNFWDENFQKYMFKSPAPTSF